MDCADSVQNRRLKLGQKQFERGSFTIESLTSEAAGSLLAYFERVQRKLSRVVAEIKQSNALLRT